jgi:hypothetical protein
MRCASVVKMKNTIFNEILAYAISIGAIAALWALFYKFASPKIIVEISEGSILFKSDKAQISLKPLLHISKLKKRYRLLSVGEEFCPTEPAIRVDLLNYKGESGGTKEYLECVSAFFRHGFSQVVGRKLLVVPKVTIRGTEYIYANISELNDNLFSKALKRAGAIECTFA